jgi:YidC/Oxa1 family membrane protein insertase
LQVAQENAGTFATREGYELSWDGGIPFTEGDPTQEALKAGAFARSGGEVEGVTLNKEAYEERSLRGDVSWIGTKNQYFVAVVMPQGATRGAELIGERIGETDAPDLREAYESRLLMPAAEAGSVDAFTLYIGPMEYNRISRYDLNIYDMVDYGWDFFEWITRPIAKFVFIPLFSILSGFIPSFGVIIIILAILIKIVVYPLTKKSYRSMAQMRELQPRLEAIKEKHADNPQKQQEATMKLYRESGVNPLGGCLPMFMQYPVIIALWQFLPQSIEIRQQGFLWAHDLSAPDIILNLPFTIPLYGNFVAGFCMLMGVSMVIQMRIKSTPASGPQQKKLMYLMPAMLFFIFIKWASGLNLYYLCYNILTAIQQRFINKSIEREKEAGGADGGNEKSAVRSNGKGRGRSNRLQNGRNGKASKRSSRVKR